MQFLWLPVPQVVQLPASSPQDDGPTGRDFLGGGEMFYSDEEETYKLVLYFSTRRSLVPAFDRENCFLFFAEEVTETQGLQKKQGSGSCVARDV